MDEALNQIERKRYETELASLGIEHIVKIGIAFCKKRAVVRRDEKQMSSAY